MKKYKIFKIIEMPDDFRPESMDCEEACPFGIENYDEGRFECRLYYDCPFRNKDGWKCEVTE